MQTKTLTGVTYDDAAGVAEDGKGVFINADAFIHVVSTETLNAYREVGGDAEADPIQSARVDGIICALQMLKEMSETIRLDWAFQQD